MKKTIIQLFIFLVLMTLFITGCTKENKLDENSISIVATNFPSYDFARSVITKVEENYLAPTNNFTNVDIKLLIKPGMETHSFDPTPKDIIDIQNADIFIYMGGHSETWVEKILATSNKLPKKIIKLKDVVDIYLVDMKYCDDNLAFKLSKAKDYSSICKQAIIKMRKNQPVDIIENGIMKKGVIVRHLVLPNEIQNSFDVLNWINSTLGANTIISLMGQYTPCHLALQIPEYNRKLKPIEYKRVINHMQKLGFNNGFVQELTSASESYIPDFDKFND